MARTKSTLTAPGETAAERLAAVLAEIAELDIPLPAADHDTDLDELSTALVDRRHRADALRAVIPALERQVLLEAIPRAEAVMKVEGEAREVAGRAMESATNDRDEAYRRYVVAFDAWQHAGDRFTYATMERNKAQTALREHDEKHNPEPSVTSFRGWGR